MPDFLSLHVNKIINGFPFCFHFRLAARMDSSRPGLGDPLPHLEQCVYLDWNATTPIFPEVAEEMHPFIFEVFGNPSSGHTYGRRSKEAVDLARSRVASLVNAPRPDCIVFTACGTESNNWAIHGSVQRARMDPARRGATPHVVASVIEHPAVLEYLKQRKASHGGTTASTDAPLASIAS